LKNFGIENIDAITLAQYINFIDTVVVGVEPKANDGYDLKVKPWAEIQFCDDGKEKPAIEDDGRSKAKLPSNIFPVPKMRRIPIVGAIRAGMPILAEENIEGYEYDDVPEDQGYFFLRVKGDSMIGAHILDGSLALIKPRQCAEDGQIVACLVNGDEATLKRFYQQKDMVILKPENPAYSPIVVPCSDFDSGYARILGVVTEVKFKV